jgi:hypothetical protein
MKGETLLGIGLRLLSVLLVICPILIAFQVNNWDLKKTLFEESGVREVEDKLSGLNFENVTWTVVENEVEYNEVTREARIPIDVYSDLGFQIKILEVEFDVSFDGQHATLRMHENEVELIPKEKARMHIVGTFYEDPRGKEIRVDTGWIVIEKLGVIIEVRPKE